jgi:hypothetical protein
LLSINHLKHDSEAISLFYGVNMLSIELADEERDALADVLKSHLAEMYSEISNTDNSRFKDDLKQKKALLQRIYETVKRT